MRASNGALSWLNALYGVFFIRVSPSKAAVLRISLGIVALLNELMWSGHLIEVFGDRGFFPNQFVSRHIPQLQFSVLLHVTDPLWVWGFFVVLVGATVCFTLGIHARVANLIMYLLLVSFHVRAPLVHNGPINLLCIASFFTLFLRTDADLALLPAKRRGGGESKVDGWPIRMIQAQVAIVYLFTAVEKIRVSPQWFNGSYLFYTLTWPPYSIYDMSWLREFPSIVNLVTWFTLFAELMFFFWVWFKQTRVIVLASLVLMHLGSIVLMNVDYFGETILALYVVFLTDKECESLCAWVKRRWSIVRLGYEKAA